MPEGECRFDLWKTCTDHEHAPPTLCSHAADELRAKVAEAHRMVERAGIRLQAKKRLYDCYAGHDHELQLEASTCDHQRIEEQEEHAGRLVTEHQSLLATRDAQVGKMREALEAIALRVPIMVSTGDYRTGQEHALEECSRVARAALASGGRDKESTRE